MIDTLAMYQKLKASGLQSKQAEAITRAICLAHSAHVADLNAQMVSEAKPSVTKKDA
jgi:hypothetical protein